MAIGEEKGGKEDGQEAGQDSSQREELTESFHSENRQGDAELRRLARESFIAQSWLVEQEHRASQTTFNSLNSVGEELEPKEKSVTERQKAELHQPPPTLKEELLTLRKRFAELQVNVAAAPSPDKAIAGVEKTNADIDRYLRKNPISAFVGKVLRPIREVISNQLDPFKVQNKLTVINSVMKQKAELEEQKKQLEQKINGWHTQLEIAEKKMARIESAERMLKEKAKKKAHVEDDDDDEIDIKSVSQEASKELLQEKIQAFKASLRDGRVEEKDSKSQERALYEQRLELALPGSVEEVKQLTTLNAAMGGYYKDLTVPQTEATKHFRNSGTIDRLLQNIQSRAESSLTPPAVESPVNPPIESAAEIGEILTDVSRFKKEVNQSLEQQQENLKKIEAALDQLNNGTNKLKLALEGPAVALEKKWTRWEGHAKKINEKKSRPKNLGGWIKKITTAGTKKPDDIELTPTSSTIDLNSDAKSSTLVSSSRSSSLLAASDASSTLAPTVGRTNSVLTDTESLSVDRIARSPVSSFMGAAMQSGSASPTEAGSPSTWSRESMSGDDFTPNSSVYASSNGRESRSTARTEISETGIVPNFSLDSEEKKGPDINIRDIVVNAREAKYSSEFKYEITEHPHVGIAECVAKAAKEAGQELAGDPVTTDMDKPGWEADVKLKALVQFAEKHDKNLLKKAEIQDKKPSSATRVTTQPSKHSTKL